MLQNHPLPRLPHLGQLQLHLRQDGREQIGRLPAQGVFINSNLKFQHRVRSC